MKSLQAGMKYTKKGVSSFVVDAESGEKEIIGKGYLPWSAADQLKTFLAHVRT